MTEDKDILDIEESEELEEELSMDGGDDSPDDVTELPREIKIQSGNCPELELEALRPICTLAEQNYQAVQEHIKKLRNANQMLQRFHARDNEVTPKDVDQAKREFNEAKLAYMELGNKINAGIKQVHMVNKSYPEDLLTQNLYGTYLAKLISSLETRNHVEPYVRRLAEYMFVFDREDIILTEEEERRDMTVEIKKAELLAEAEKKVARLEARYQKRQLQNRIKQGERPGKIIGQLIRLSRLDPEDIHTFIWIAQMMSEELPKQRDPNKRLEFRDDVLKYCQKAFALIDDFLNMQGIENLSDRDKQRSEYLKTITSIRKPLLGSG